MALETRHNVLQAARSLFVQQGYTATSMRQVAEAAGIGKATIYHHFPDKQSIAQALLEDSLSGMDSVLEIVQAEANPRRRIYAAAEFSMGALFTHADLWQVVRREVPGGREFMQARMAAFFRQYIALIATTVQAGIDQGLFRPIEPLRAGRVFLTLIQGAFATAMLSGELGQSPTELANLLLDVYFQGIDAR